MPPLLSTVIKKFLNLKIIGAVRRDINVSFSSQNVNSLNLTGLKANFDLKVSAIKNLNTDVIFLSDTRLVNSNGVKGDFTLSNALRDFRGKKYTPFFNSSKNSRGTAILLASEIGFTVNEIFRDQDENVLILDVSLKNSHFLLGSIYGPNNTCRGFYNFLREIFIRKPNHEIVLGGDWNTVLDRTIIDFNIDVFGMAALPNAKNGEYLEGLCMDFKLCDPFRTLYPSKRAFSYSPFGTIRQNRSRLDFFVVSQSLIPNIVDCSISPGLSTKLFDHKSVLLSLGTKTNEKKKPGPRVGNSFLKENYVIASVNLAAIKCHVHSLELENNL